MSYYFIKFVVDIGLIYTEVDYVQTYYESMMATGASLALVDSVVCALLICFAICDLYPPFPIVVLLSNATFSAKFEV